MADATSKVGGVGGIVTSKSLIYLCSLALGTPQHPARFYTILSRCKMLFYLLSYVALIAALVNPQSEARDIYARDSQISLQHVNDTSSRQSSRPPREARGCAGSKLRNPSPPRPPHPRGTRPLDGPLPPGEPHPLVGYHVPSGPPHPHPPDPFGSRVVFHQPLVPMRQDLPPPPGRPNVPSRIPPTRPPKPISSGLVSDQDRAPHPIGGPYPPGRPPREHPIPGALAWNRQISPAKGVYQLQCQSYTERCLSNCICRGPKLHCGNDARRRTPVRDPVYIAYLEGLCGRSCNCSLEQDAEQGSGGA